MSIELKIQAARRAAAKLVAYYGIERSEHICLEDIAYERGAEVVRARLDGATARLSKLRDKSVIRVSDRVGNLGQERFSVAHEIGHLVLVHQTALFSCADEELHDFGGRSVSETEANAFAAELLLPEKLVRERCEVSPVTLDVVRNIADDFTTSMTATAIRFVQLTSERCAVVFSVDRKIRWFVKNSDFWPYIPRGTELSKWSLAYDYFAKGSVSERSEQIDASAWASEESLRGLEELYEHSMSIPSMNAVLSLLWIPES